MRYLENVKVCRNPVLVQTFLFFFNFSFLSQTWVTCETITLWNLFIAIENKLKNLNES